MIDVLRVTTPIYLLIALGFVAVRQGWMAAPEMRVLGRFVAQFGVPALVFRAASRQTAGGHLDYLFVYLAGSLLAAGSVLLIARFVRGRPMSLAAIQALGAAASNSAFVGYPIVEQAIGATAGLALALTMVVENVVLMPLMLALANSGRAGGGGPRTALVAAAKGLLRTPMIVAVFAGFALGATGFVLPPVLDRTVAMVASAAPPVSLFVIGGTLVGLQLAGIRGDLALVAFGKLVWHPLCVLGLVLLVSLADPKLRLAAVLFAAMPMLSIYPVLAQRFGHERFSAAALLAATVGSFFTITALIALLPASWRG